MKTALEIAQVGAIPLEDLREVGYRFNLAGAIACVTGEITKQAFLNRVEAAGFHNKGFEAIPDHVHFYTISLD